MRSGWAGRRKRLSTPGSKCPRQGAKYNEPRRLRSNGREACLVFPSPRIMERLQLYRHRAPVIVAVEVEPEPERLRWWEAMERPAAEAGAALVVITPVPAIQHGVVHFVDPELSHSVHEGPKVWILDAYLEPRVCLDALRLDSGLRGQILAWVEGVQHECPE